MAGTPGALTQVGIAKESVWGTYVNPTTLAAVTDFSIDPTEGRIFDESMDGSLKATARASYAGRRWASISISTLAYPQLTGQFVMAALGIDSVSAVTGASRHTFAVSATTLPPSYTITAFDGNTSRYHAGCKLNSLSLTGSGGESDAVTVQAEFIGLAGASTAKPSLTAESADPFLGWETQTVVGGSTITPYQSWTVNLNRNAQPILTLDGAQAPNDVIQSAIDGDFSVTTLYDDLTEVNRVYNHSKSSLKLVSRSAVPTMTITCSGPSWDSLSLSPSKGDPQTVDISGRLVYHSTDSGIIGVTLDNARTTAY